MDRNFRVSIVKATGSQVEKVTTFRQLLAWMLRDKNAIETGKRLAKLHESDTRRYDIEKRKQPGFIIGEFSYRNADSCTQYEPVLGYDIDHVTNYDQYVDLMTRLRNWPYTFVAMPSISQAGIRVLIYSNSTRQKHADLYAQGADMLADLLQIPTKSQIKKRLTALSLTPDKIKSFLNENAHIDDTTKDICRFWYYSGLTKDQIYVNKKSELVKGAEKTDKPLAKITNQNSDYAYKFTEEDKVEYLIGKIESSATDITSGVTEWFKIGLAIYDLYGQSGYDYFDRVSRYHPDYKPLATKTEWDRIAKKYRPGGPTIASFYQACKEFSLEIDYKELAGQLSHKFPDKNSKQVSLDKKPTSIEIAVLSTCIYKPNFIETIFDICPKFSSECFQSYQSQQVFSCIQRLRKDRMAVAPLSVAAKLKYTDLDSEKVMEAYDHAFVSGSDFPTNIRIVYSDYLKRKIIDLNQESIRELNEEDQDVFEYLANFYEQLKSLSDYGTSQTISTGYQLALAVQERYDLVYKARQENGSAITGVPTGLLDEDKITGGYQDGDLIVLAARPGMGKTSKALKTVLVNIEKEVPVGFFSLEMPSIQLGQRLVSIAERIELTNIRNGNLSQQEYARFHRAIEMISTLPIYIDDKGASTVSYIEMTARKWRREHEIQLLVIDYLQLISTNQKHNTRHEQIGSITKAIKALAKELDIPILLLSQLNRAVENRGGEKRPMLSDLRDSGSIEEDADVVQFIYRPEYYEILNNSDGESTANKADIIFAKNRNGSLKTISCAFNKQFTEFLDSGQYDSQKAKPTSSQFPVSGSPDSKVPF